MPPSAQDSAPLRMRPRCFVRPAGATGKARPFTGFQAGLGAARQFPGRGEPGQRSAQTDQRMSAPRTNPVGNARINAHWLNGVARYCSNCRASHGESPRKDFCDYFRGPRATSGQQNWQPRARTRIHHFREPDTLPAQEIFRTLRLHRHDPSSASDVPWLAHGIQRNAFRSCDGPHGLGDARTRTPGDGKPRGV